MKDSRLGESLWFVWDLKEPTDGSLLFYTEGHVDLENEVVRKALASTLQREGVSDSLARGFNMIQVSEVIYGYSGLSPFSDVVGWPCNENGETEDGYILEFITPSTWVKVSTLD